MTERPPLGVQGREQSIQQLLKDSHYAIDFYQREYKWGKEHVTALLEDLADKFFSFYKPAHERKEVANYGNYFLGAIVVNRRDGQSYIIDGQQRLTSLTLLLIYLHHLSQEPGSPRCTDVRALIFSETLGEQSFNLDIPERANCMKALFENAPRDTIVQTEPSVRNLVERYSDIEENLPPELKNHALPYFIDWLILKVVLVEIVAFSEEDAYTIFETMNDRGLSLSPTDMLKGYLLNNVADADARERLDKLWRERLAHLRAAADLAKEKEGDAAFFKAWLRAKYADTIRDRKRDATNKDFELIGKPFHKWVRDHHADKTKQLGLYKSADFRDFIAKQFVFFAKQYERILEASAQFDPDLEYVYFNASNGFTLQPPLLLAPLCPDDDQATIEHKLRLVSGYIDLFIARRIWNWKTLGYSSIVYTMFNLMKDIRDKPVHELASILRQRAAAFDELPPFSKNPHFRMHGQNQYYTHRLLARLTYHIERECKRASHFADYIDQTAKKPFEVEHIWANHYDQHKEEFESEQYFLDYRNQIGGLLLLPRGFNQSLNDDSYEAKVTHYYGQNLLAQSLSAQCYTKNPDFRAYVQRSGLPFQPHEHFRKANLDQRQQLYLALAEQIWSPDRFDKELR